MMVDHGTKKTGHFSRDAHPLKGSDAGRTMSRGLS